MWWLWQLDFVRVAIFCCRSSIVKLWLGCRGGCDDHIVLTALVG